MSKVDTFLLQCVKTTHVRIGILVVLCLQLVLVVVIDRVMFLDFLVDLLMFVLVHAVVELLEDQALQELPLTGFDK